MRECHEVFPHKKKKRKEKKKKKETKSQIHFSEQWRYPPFPSGKYPSSSPLSALFQSSYFNAAGFSGSPQGGKLKGITHIHNLLGHRPELDLQGIALLLEQTVTHLGSLQPLLHLSEGPAKSQNRKRKEKKKKKKEKIS